MEQVNKDREKRQAAEKVLRQPAAIQVPWTAQQQVNAGENAAQADRQPDTVGLEISEAPERDVPENLEWRVIVGEQPILETKLSVKGAQDFLLISCLLEQVIQLRSPAIPDHSSCSVEGDEIIVPLMNPLAQIPAYRDIGRNQGD